jgi:predicted ATP-grasp superfamily ATP-dependent carboligase
MSVPLTEAKAKTPARPVSDFPVEGVGGVVVGGDYQGLGITRSLGRRGRPVVIIDSEFSISRFSRYATRSVRVDDLLTEEKVIESLLDTARKHNLRGWVLYPTRDETVAAIARHRDVLSEWYRLPTPEWKVVRQAWDKRCTYKLAAELGIPFPKSWFPKSVEELAAVDGEFPLVIKPAIKEHFFYAARAKAWLAKDRAELIDLYRKASEFTPSDELIIQEYVPGGSSQQYGYGAFFKNGKALGHITTHNQRCHPPQFGRSSTFVQTIDLPILAQHAERFLSAMNYYGLAEIEFRFDEKSGQYKILDVNARTWGYHSIGAAAGPDFAHMVFEDQLGREPAATSFKPGVTWVRFCTDLPVGFHGVWLKEWSLWEYLKTLRRVKVEAVFAAEDPLPSVVEWALVPYLAATRGY